MGVSHTAAARRGTYRNVDRASLGVRAELSRCSLRHSHAVSRRKSARYGVSHSAMLRGTPKTIFNLKFKKWRDSSAKKKTLVEKSEKRKEKK